MTTTMEDKGSRQISVDWSLLPEDLIFEVLTRVPFESLPSCRKVCSSWCRTTHHPNFIALHSHRTGTLTGYFLQSMTRNAYASSFVPFTPMSPSTPPPSLEFLPEGTQILSSTHRGILLCKSPYKYLESRHYVCKPATKQFRGIPSPRTRFEAIGTEIVASSSGILHFKIVRLSRTSNFTYTICDIFDSRTWRWRRHREKLPPLIRSSRPAVEVDNVLYWQLGYSSDDIFAFDVMREQWRWILPPKWEKHEKIGLDDSKLLTAFGGQLCLIRATRRDEHSNHELEMWRMVDCAEGKLWKRIGSCRLPGLMSPPTAVEDLYSPEAVFLTGIGEAMWLDLRRGQLRQTSIDHRVADRIFKFESDLTSCSFDARIDLL